MLAGLAALRTRSTVRALAREGRVWLFWPASDTEIADALLPVAGTVVYCRRGGFWFQHGRRLPAFTVPDAKAAGPLALLLSPQPVQPLATSWLPTAVPLELVRDSRARPASAVRCGLPSLARWAERATTRQIERLTAARCGDRVLLRGERLPALDGSERWWGDRVLAPLGFRPDPDVCEPILIEALGIAPDSLAVLDHAGLDVVPASAFAPATRAGIRLAAERRS